MKFRELDTFAIRYAAAADYLKLTIIADCTEPRAEAAARADTPRSCVAKRARGR
jgi:hypothetical protein